MINLLFFNLVDDVPDHIKQLLKQQETDKLNELKSPQSEDGMYKILSKFFNWVKVDQSYELT